MNKRSGKNLIRGALLRLMFNNLEDYDIEQYERYRDQYNMKYLKTRLDESTAVFSYGCDVAVACPMDVINASVIDELLECGVKLLAMRSAGYNNVDLEYAHKKRLPVVNVPDYSPYSIAEYAIAMMLTVGRKTHKAYNRTREHNFSLAHLAGFEFHGRTVGVIGEGRTTGGSIL